MKNKIGIRLVIVLLLLVILSVTALANMNESPQSIDTQQVLIDNEMIDILKLQKPTHYEAIIEDYKKLIVTLDVHPNIKKQLEQLVIEDYPLTDIMITYIFLNDVYGTYEELIEMLNARKMGESYVSIFTRYNQEIIEFIPSSFDSDYLDQLMYDENLSVEQIMIADRIAQKTGNPIESIIEQKLSGTSYKDINNSYGILNSLDRMKRVEVYDDQIKKYQLVTGLDQDLIIEGIVIAGKFLIEEEAVIESIVSGLTQEQIIAEYLESRYTY